MNRLLEIGFQTAGRWALVDGRLSLELLRHGSQRNVLYAFVSDGDVKYVGKTTRTLAARLYGYSNPGQSQATNVRNNRLICELLQAGATVEVLALPDNGLMHYGQFHINLAAGLEDSIITLLNPEWNGKPTALPDEVETSTPAPPLTEFTFILQKTYFRTGFFNVPVDHSEAFGKDGEQIDIFCGETSGPLIGTINRRANTTGAPRIMGGTGLRDWFQAQAEMMQDIRVTVQTPNEIHMDARGT